MSIEGLDALDKRLAKIQANAARVPSILRDIAKERLERARPKAPVLTGATRRSGGVKKARTVGGVVLFFGGDTAPGAWWDYQKRERDYLDDIDKPPIGPIIAKRLMEE